MAEKISVIIPTRDRRQQITGLLESFKRLTGIARIHPEIIVGDNASKDQTWCALQKISADFPAPLRLLQVNLPGKSRVLNDAIRTAQGEVLAFLDDDVVLDPDWLIALEKYFSETSCSVAQGTIRIPSEDLADPAINRLIERFRTVHRIEYKTDRDDFESLNGANMVIRREVIDKVGNFDTRLGPGASGTSEDVEMARRIRRAGIKIGYISRAVVYHEVTRRRLTEEYFKSFHKRQGVSRLRMNDRGMGQIVFDLARSSVQFGAYSLAGRERDKYRSKGRVFHYLAMLEAKFLFRER